MSDEITVTPMQRLEAIVTLMTWLRKRAKAQQLRDEADHPESLHETGGRE
jgi:hypothetical protein